MLLAENGRRAKKGETRIRRGYIMWPFSTLLPHTCSTARVDTTRTDVPCGLHRCTCIAATRRGYMMYNRHRVMQWRICKPASPPGVRFSLPPPRQSPRKRTVNTEGCRKSCTYIFVYSTHLRSPPSLLRATYAFVLHR